MPRHRSGATAPDMHPVDGSGGEAFCAGWLAVVWSGSSGRVLILWTVIVSMLDRAWRWRHRFGGFGVIVVDDVDTILQRLSVAYLDEAVAVASTELEGHLGRPVQLQPAFFHPAKDNWLPDATPRSTSRCPAMTGGVPSVVLAGSTWSSAPTASSNPTTHTCSPTAATSCATGSYGRAPTFASRVAVAGARQRGRDDHGGATRSAAG